MPRGAPLQPKWRDDLFGGVMTLTAKAERLVPGDGEGQLYSTAPPAARDVALTALPYHLWANREPGSMEVWVAEAAGEDRSANAETAGRTRAAANR